MADVAATLPLWSTTRASNSPSGSTTVGTGWDDNLREMQGVLRGWLASKGADIASAATTDLGAVEGLFHDITGTTTITGFGTISAGIWKVLKFEGVLTLTHNATSLILPGGVNITTAVGDMLMATSEGSGNWRVNWYVTANASPIGPFIDSNPIVVGSADGTKKWRVEVDGFTTGNTRVFTPPDADLTLPAVTAKGDMWSASASGVMAKTAVGTDSQVWTADSASSAGVKWAAQGLALLGSKSLSNAASVTLGTVGAGVADIQFDWTAYDEYEVHFVNFINATNAQLLRAQISTDGGSTFISTGTYAYVNFTYANTSTSVATGSAQTSIVLTPNTQSSSFDLNFILKLNKPNSSIAKEFYTGNMVFVESTGSALSGGNTVANNSGTAAYDGMKFFYGSGNISSGVVYVYGIRKT